MVAILRGLFGLIFLLLVAYAFSRDRKHIDWKLVGMGVGLQLIFGILITQPLATFIMVNAYQENVADSLGSAERNEKSTPDPPQQENE